MGGLLFKFFVVLFLVFVALRCVYAFRCVVDVPLRCVELRYMSCGSVLCCAVRCCVVPCRAVGAVL